MLSLARQVASEYTPNSTFNERLSIIVGPDQRWTASLGPHHLVRDVIARAWADDVIPSLSGLVAIPALSPSFDSSWAAAGYLGAAVDHMASWVAARDRTVPCEVVELDGRSPLLLVDVPASTGTAAQGTVLIYGHLDKQPALGDWSAGLGPWRPVLRDGRLYGRGVTTSQSFWSNTSCSS